MIKINLLPKEILQKQKEKQIQLAITLGILSLFVFGVMLYGVRYISYINTLSNIKNVETEMNKLKTLISDIEKIEKESALLLDKIALIEKLAKKRYLVPKFLETFARAVPQGVWIVSLNTENKKDMLDVTCNGAALDTYAISNFITNLKKDSLISNVKLSYIQTSILEKATVRYFSIYFQYVDNR